MFYLEKDKITDLISPDTAVVAELLAQKAWKEGKNVGSYFLPTSWQEVEFRSLGYTSPDKSEKDLNPIPVGSVEFCEAFLGKKIRPLNIPACLRDESYICRRVAEATADKIPQYFRDWHADRLFIKSATTAKSPCTGLYRKTDLQFLPADDVFLVSEPLDFKAEWRCFVYKGVIKDIRRYAGSYKSQFTSSDIEFAKDIVKTIDAGVRPKLDAYTLDLGKTTARDVPVVVELHNFLACGLYGFEDPVILPMIEAAVRREREEH